LSGDGGSDHAEPEHPEETLGASKHVEPDADAGLSYDDLQAHPFFRDVDWDLVQSKRAEAPWKPQAKDLAEPAGATPLSWESLGEEFGLSLASESGVSPARAPTDSTSSAGSTSASAAAAIPVVLSPGLRMTPGVSRKDELKRALALAAAKKAAADSTESAMAKGSSSATSVDEDEDEDDADDDDSHD